MTQTNHIKLNLLHNYQIHKETLINENSVIIDSLMFSGVASIRNMPDEQSEIGTKYIIPSTEDNFWKDKQHHLAIKLEGRWEIIHPKEGMIFWIIDESKQVVYSNGTWKVIGSIIGDMMQLCSTDTT